MFVRKGKGKGEGGTPVEPRDANGPILHPTSHIYHKLKKTSILPSVSGVVDRENIKTKHDIDNFDLRPKHPRTKYPVPTLSSSATARGCSLYPRPVCALNALNAPQEFFYFPEKCPTLNADNGRRRSRYPPWRPTLKARGQSAQHRNRRRRLFTAARSKATSSSKEPPTATG